MNSTATMAQIRSPAARARTASTVATVTTTSSAATSTPAASDDRDEVDCGPGYDTFEADYEDRVLDNCEEGSVGGF